MVVYSLEQGWEFLKHYFEKHGNVAECGKREAPSATHVRYLAKTKKKKWHTHRKRTKAKNSAHTRILHKDLGMTP